MSWPAHPDDEWVDATRFGDDGPLRLLARSGVEAEVARQRDRYLAGQITADEFEERVDGLLRTSFATYPHGTTNRTLGTELSSGRGAAPQPAPR